MILKIKKINIPNVCYVSKFAFLFYIYKLTRLKYGRNKKTQKEKLTTKIFEIEIFIVNLNCGFEISKFYHLFWF